MRPDFKHSNKKIKWSRVVIAAGMVLVALGSYSFFSFRVDVDNDEDDGLR